MNAIVMIILLSISLFFNLSSSTKIRNPPQKQIPKLVFPQIEQPYEPETVSKLPKIEAPKYDEEDEDDQDDMDFETNRTINNPTLEETPKLYSMVIQAKPTSIIHSVKRDGKMVIPSTNLIQGLGKVKVLNDGKLQIPVDIANNPVTDPILRNSFENPKFVPKEELIETIRNKLINDQKKLEENESLLEPEDFILTEDEDNRKIKLAETHKTEEEKIAMCKSVTDAKADYIKTSTGFGTAGATIEDIKLFKQHIGPDVKIKAAGGVKTVEDLEMFINEGCERIGTSSAINLIKGKEAQGY